MTMISYCRWTIASVLVPRWRQVFLLRRHAPSAAGARTAAVQLSSSSSSSQLSLTIRRLASSSSSSPPSEDLVTLDYMLDENGHSSKVAQLTMQNLPANSLSLEMCQALTKTIQKAESNESTQALVLQSAASPKIFSAGLDLKELHRPDPDRLSEFWTSFQDLYLTLYGSRLACIAAIEGHAPAAGCMLALSCDYRIMINNPSLAIGLNESKLGIAAPPWLGRQLMDTIGRREAERALALGVLYTPEQAEAIGLVDEVVETRDNAAAVRTRALEHASEWAAIPAPARVASKQLVRQERLDKLRCDREQDLEHFVSFVTQEGVQQSLSAYLEQLSRRRKKPTS